MVEIQYQCAECNKEIKARVNQTIVNSKLKWYLSSICNDCNSAVEMDDFGFPPPEIRQKILEEEGEWELKANSAELKNKVKIIKVLRKALNLSIKDASTFLKNLPNIINGTKVEMQWLKELLLDNNIQSFIKKTYN